MTLGKYADRWLDERVDLRPRTRELYRGLLDRHIGQHLGAVALSALTPARVRTWHAELVTVYGVGRSTVAKSYRLLRAVLATAVIDGLIARNPCQIRGGGVERPAERPTASVVQVYALANAVRPRFRAFVLLAAFSGCRWGELVALTRRHLDVEEGRVQIVSTWVEPVKGRPFLGPPKSDAGRRTVVLPQVVLPDLQRHLDVFSGDGRDGLVFPGSKGAVISRRNFNKAAGWAAATKSVGLDGFHFHDLRHTGNTLAASTGASLRELMARAGQSSPRAALIYQHATETRSEVVARAMALLIMEALDGRERGGSS
ncbi:site-specific integrase [Frankia sp. CeD]|uniref:tyrosine-type recombinase/integrase n=1 Tax=Frankia sp. CeD TaxID=258230 RepID=UPI000A68E698|nr:site-specific integrase [Frankia sp. CeD]